MWVKSLLILISSAIKCLNFEGYVNIFLRFTSHSPLELRSPLHTSLELEFPSHILRAKVPLTHTPLNLGPPFHRPHVNHILARPLIVLSDSMNCWVIFQASLIVGGGHPFNTHPSLLALRLKPLAFPLWFASYAMALKLRVGKKR